jgi:hypothetical protein
VTNIPAIFEPRVVNVDTPGMESVTEPSVVMIAALPGATPRAARMTADTIERKCLTTTLLVLYSPYTPQRRAIKETTLSIIHAKIVPNFENAAFSCL